VKPKVLLVDDEPLMHFLYRKHLEAAGYEMLAASNAEEAIATVIGKLPQVIIMDIMMPGEDGLSALREIKKLDFAKAIPVIVISANVNYYDIAISESGIAGAAAFLSKPLSPARLLAELKRVALRPAVSA